MPKKLKLKDWQDEVRRGNPEMFEGASKPLKLVDPKPSPLAKAKIETQEKKTIWQRLTGK